jgi:hypothetical protein
MFGDSRREISDDFTLLLLPGVRRGCRTDYTICILWLTTGISFLLFIFSYVTSIRSLYLRREMVVTFEKRSEPFAKAAWRWVVVHSGDPQLATIEEG